VYNQWPYGLDGLNHYMQRVGVNAIKLRYAARHVTYVIGEHAAVDDPAPDGTCAALLQGADRAARMQNYAKYLDIIYGGAARETHNFVTARGAGNDPMALFGSPCAMTQLFGDGVCQPQAEFSR
jgi:hypothetical protein